jgi:polysaccharide biosynthesis/export protein
LKPLLFAALMLTAFSRSDDGGRMTLTFDGPVAFTQATRTDPDRLVIDVNGAAVADAALQDASRAGAVVERRERPAGIRVTVPLSAGSSATVASSDRAITIDVSRAPLIVGATAQAPAQPSTPPAETADYMIGPEDLLEINVFELPELKTTTRVLEDGTVSLPLLGVVQAAGLTKTLFEQRVRDLLEARFLHDPQVTVSVTEFRSKQVSVIGAVNKPGTYQMIGPRTVLQMISEAGGLSREAGTGIIILRKSATGRSERLELDLQELVIKGNPELNLAVAPGDVINVPEDRPIYVFVDGAVRNPGQVEGRVSRPITVLQAVARTGGLTERANLRGVHVLRKDKNGGQSRIPVNLRDIRKGKADDVVLQDGDVVVVPETFF